MPRFVIQPMNTTVLTNRSVGFSCSIRPDSTLINITWYFDPVPLDVGSGNDSYDLMTITNGVISGLPHFGTSILSLDYVTEQDRGFYFCVAFFNNGNLTSSGQAFLEITGKSQYYTCTCTCVCEGFVMCVYVCLYVLCLLHYKFP